MLNRLGVYQECDRQIDRRADQTHVYRLFDSKCRPLLCCVAKKTRCLFVVVRMAVIALDKVSSGQLGRV